MSYLTKSGRDRYRKHYGGRTNGCHMSCDYLTPRQLEELNGEVHTYQMNKPVTWEQFKGYPAEFQREYLDGLIAEYNVNYTTLSEMLGVGRSSIKRLIEKNRLGVTFQVGHSMTGEQRKAWKRFLSQEPDCPVPTEPATECEEERAQTAPVAAMTRFAMSFQGRIDPVSIANSLTQMLGRDADGTLNIEFVVAMPLANGMVPLYNGQ